MSLRTIEFDWDQWNIQKNEIKHGISKTEAESTFSDSQHCLFVDEKHSSAAERRYILFGHSFKDRILMIGFTLRRNKIRIITARTASRRERMVYEEKKKK